jgi:hypothetical protein
VGKLGRAAAVGFLVLSSTACGAASWSNAVAGLEAGPGWTRQVDVGPETSARAIAVDNGNDVFVAGYLTPQADHVGSPSQDAFVRKYDRGGQVEWTRQFGSSHPTEARSLAVDDQGAVYVAGGVEGALAGQLRSGFTDVFVRKYDAEGTDIWTRQFGSPRDAVAYGVALSGQGDVVVVGFASGALPGQPRFGYRDAFVRKYDRDGNELWTRQFGSSQPTEARAVVADAAGRVYVVGTTLGALPGQVGAGSFDAFVRVYDSWGAELWTHQFGSDQVDVATSVALDSAANVYVAGYGLDGAGAFLRKYNRDGEELWSRAVGVPSQATGVVIDPSGFVYLAGANVVTTSARAGGAEGPFILKYDVGVGEPIAVDAGTPSKANLWSITVGPSGSVAVTGDADAIPGERARTAFVLQLPR